MATAHSTSKGRSGRNRQKSGLERRKTVRRRQPSVQDSASSQGPARPAAIRIRGALREFLESERDFLLKAESVLLCITQSMDDSRHPSAGPYYPDVVELASDLVKRRAVRLDELLLDGRVPGNAT